MINFQLSGNGNGNGQGKGKGDGQGNAEEQAKRNATGGGVDREVVEVSLVAAPGEKKEVPKDFFYGIGVSVYKAMINGVEVMGITDVYQGYPAIEHGITTQDTIIALDGMPVNDKNDIASDKQRTIVLTLSRGGVLRDVTILTEKIYFRH